MSKCWPYKLINLGLVIRQDANFNHKEGYFDSMITKILFVIFSVLFVSSYARMPDPILHDSLVRSINHLVPGGPDPKHDPPARINHDVSSGEPNPIHNPLARINYEVPGGPNHIHNPLASKNQP
jgi:hypothetical protein